jgi:hypothetical protein
MAQSRNNSRAGNNPRADHRRGQHHSSDLFRVPRLRRTGDDQEPNDQRPFLTIPYWGPLSPMDQGDTGEVRPLATGGAPNPDVPSTVIDWLCPSIHASPYAPGTPLTITIDVHNAGGGDTDSIVLVRAWWENISTVFKPPTPDRLIGVTPIALPPRGHSVTTDPLTRPIPSDAGDHICVVACVSHQLDPIPPSDPTKPASAQLPDPDNDRHWAQRNLWVTTPSPGMPIDVTFWAANPFDFERDFTFRVRPIDRQKLFQMTRTVRSEPIFSEVQFEFYESGSIIRQGGGRPLNAPYLISLNPRERRSMFIRAELGISPGEGQFTGFEILQFDQDGSRQFGGLGVVAQGPSDQHNNTFRRFRHLRR